MSQPEYSPRGFAFWDPIQDTYGAAIDVHESSAARGPHLWVHIQGTCHLTDEPRQHPGISHGVAPGGASAHLSMESARQLRDSLDAAIKHSEARFGE